MGAIASILHSLFEVTLGFRWVAINMAHELSVMWLASGLAAREILEELQALSMQADAPESLAELTSIVAPVFAESRLGLYVCRNFLSHVSESRYTHAVDVKFSHVDLNSLVEDIVGLHRRTAVGKRVKIRIEEPLKLPHIRGVPEELRRAFHNVLSNAIKYSYHSGDGRSREIRVWSKVPFDPGFRAARFAVIFQNYGLGLTPDELPNVGKPGFRGRQAVAEVPIGSGIGLSEVKKIMALHGGEVRVRSRQVHRDDTEPYLTEVSLIFPLSHRGAAH